MGLYSVTLIEKEYIRDNLVSMKFSAPEIAEKFKSGQFINIDCGNEFSLRRPISISSVCENTVKIVFEIKGNGTKRLAEREVGDVVSVMGPLGNSFSDIGKKVLFVGGGIGVFPLLSHAEKYGENADVLLGFRNASQVCYVSEFQKVAGNVMLFTDDGSMGNKGYATDYTAKIIKNYDAVFACGPKIMLQKIAEIANDNGIFCEISLEERMGCGIGACLVCACKIRKSDGETYLHVCKDGPVFNSKDVIFDD